MASVLMECFYFVLTIAVGFFLKRAGIFKKTDGDVLSKVIVYITLPCAVLSGANAVAISPLTLLLIGLAIACNLLLAGLGYLASGRKDPKTRAAYMINGAGYNVGSVALPFVQTFFPGAGVSYLCMFDAGNAVMGLGGIYSIAASVASGEKRLDLKRLVGTLSRSVCFDTYMAIFILSLFHLELPAVVRGAASMMGKGNAFLTMLMVGIMLEVKIPRDEVRDVCVVLGLRVCVNLALGCLIYVFLPIPLLARKVLLIILACPPASVAVVFTKMCGYKKDMPAVVSSAALGVSLVEIMGVLLVTG